jgi:hypothetical protein
LVCNVPFGVNGSSISPHSNRHSRPGYKFGLVRYVGEGVLNDVLMLKLKSFSLVWSVSLGVGVRLCQCMNNIEHKRKTSKTMPTIQNTNAQFYILAGKDEVVHWIDKLSCDQIGEIRSRGHKILYTRGEKILVETLGGSHIL